MEKEKTSNRAVSQKIEFSKINNGEGETLRFHK
jgi:hypothetical protein